MSIQIRPVRPEEAEEAGRVTALAYQEFARPGDPDWDDYLARIADVPARNGRTMVLVAVEDGEVLGSVTLELEGRTEPDPEEPLADDEAHIRMLGVHPAHRRRGIARRLMEACFERAARAGRSRITLHTTQRMEAAQRMYASLGFRRTEDHVFPDGFVLLGYERDV